MLARPWAVVKGHPVGVLLAIPRQLCIHLLQGAPHALPLLLLGLQEGREKAGRTPRDRLAGSLAARLPIRACVCCKGSRTELLERQMHTKGKAPAATHLSRLQARPHIRQPVLLVRLALAGAAAAGLPLLLMIKWMGRWSVARRTGQLVQPGSNEWLRCRCHSGVAAGAATLQPPGRRCQVERGGTSLAAAGTIQGGQLFRRWPARRGTGLGRLRRAALTTWACCMAIWLQTRHREQKKGAGCNVAAAAAPPSFPRRFWPRCAQRICHATKHKERYTRHSCSPR